MLNVHSYFELELRRGTNEEEYRFMATTAAPNLTRLEKKCDTE